MTDQNENQEKKRFLDLELDGEHKTTFDALVGAEKAINDLYDMMASLTAEFQSTAKLAVNVDQRIGVIQTDNNGRMRRLEERLDQVAVARSDARKDEEFLNEQRSTAYQAGVIQGHLNAQKCIGDLIGTVRAVAEELDKFYPQTAAQLRSALKPFADK